MGSRGIAFAQIAISIVFLIGYFMIMYFFLTGQVKVPTDMKDAFIALLGVLTAAVGTIVGFWFNRTRELAAKVEGA